MDREAVADTSERIQEFTFTWQRTARRGTRNHWQAAACCERADLLRQPGVTRELPVDELQMQRTECAKAFNGRACASAITRGESSCNFALFKRHDDQQRALVLAKMLFKKCVGESRHPLARRKVGSA
jgi:hypothetical protein